MHKRALGGYRLRGILLVALLAACVVPHAKLVREAQDAFSEGAELELRNKMGAVAGNPPLSVDPATHYMLAKATAKKVLADSESKLQADSLYGTAKTIQALASWRLGERSLALKAASDVVKLADDAAKALKEAKKGEQVVNRVWPRDEGICRALPQLVRIDDLATMVGPLKNGSAEQKYIEVLKFGEGIQGALLAIEKLPVLRGNPLQVYLAQSECEMALVLYRALGKASDDVLKNLVDRYNKIRDAAIKRLTNVGAAHSLQDVDGRLANLAKYYQDKVKQLTKP